MWQPYSRAMPSSMDFLHFKFCLEFQSRAPTEMPLILTMLILTHQHREKQVDHSGVHNLSQEHVLIIASLQVTLDRTKQHNVLYLLRKQCQTPETLTSG